MSQRTNLNKSMEKSFEDLLTGLDDEEEAEPDLDDIMNKCNFLPEKVTDDTFNAMAVQNQSLTQKHRDSASPPRSVADSDSDLEDVVQLSYDTKEDDASEESFQLPRIPHQGESKTEDSMLEEEKEDTFDSNEMSNDDRDNFESCNDFQEQVVTLKTSGESNTDDLHDNTDLSPDLDEPEKVSISGDDQKDLTLFSGLDQDDSDPDIDNIIANCAYLPESVTDRTINAMVINNQSLAKSYNADEEKMRTDSSDEEPEEEEKVTVKVEVMEVEEDERENVKGENEMDGELDLKTDPSLDFSALEDTSHLSVDIGKQKTRLRKKGSLARRRKPTRENVRSALLSGEETHFLDSSEPKPHLDTVENGEVETDNVFGSEWSVDNAPMSPPAKKPTHEGIPLPGLGMPRPKPRSSSEQSETDMVLDESPKKNHKSYGIKLPMPPLKPISNQKSSESMESDGTFEKPELKKTRKPSDNRETSPQESESRFSVPELRKVPQPQKPTETLRARKDSEPDPDNYFDKPALKQVGRDDLKTRVSPESETAHVFEKPPLKNVRRKEIEIPKSSELEKTFEKPTLRNVSREQIETNKSSSEKDVSFVKPSLKSAPKPYLDPPSTPKSPEAKTFDIPALKKTPKVDRSQSSSIEGGSFEKPQLRLVGKPPVSAKVDNSEQDLESKYKFDLPGLKKVPKDQKPTETLRNMNNGSETDPLNLRTNLKATPRKNSIKQSENMSADTPSWLKDMKLKRTKSQAEDINSDVRKTDSEKPSWLQTAAEKRNKALEALHSKENQSDRDTENKAAWADTESLKKSMPNGQPLQDSTDTHTNHIHSPDATERKRLPSVESDRSSKERSPVKETRRDQYVPSWMKKKETLSKSNPNLQFVSPNGIDGDELPQWKKELAERRKSRRESDASSKNPDEKSDSSLPPWKAEMAQKKMKPATPLKSSSVTKKDEPEWKQKADEKRQRIIKSGIFDRTLRKTE